jgi:hypothetical protein
MINPRKNPYTLASRTKPPHKAKLAKEYALPTQNERMNTPYNKGYEAILLSVVQAHIQTVASNYEKLLRIRSLKSQNE